MEAEEKVRVMMKDSGTNSKKDDPVWSVQDAVVVIAVVFAVRLVLSFFDLNRLLDIGLLLSPRSPRLGTAFLGALIQTALILGPIFYFVRYKYGLSWSEVGLKRGSRGDWFWLGVKQGLALFVFIIVTGILISVFFPVEIKPQPIAELLGTARDWRGAAFAFLIASAAAPISEELYFRGFLYPALCKLTGRIPALLLAGSFFGLLHFDLWRFIPITMSGIWLTLLYERTGSLYTSIIAHSTWNTLMTLMILLAGPYAAAG